MKSHLNLIEKIVTMLGLIFAVVSVLFIVAILLIPILFPSLAADQFDATNLIVDVLRGK